MHTDWQTALIAEAMTWMGTPYHHKGRRKGVGVDCGGLIYEVYRGYVGGMKPFPTDYAPDWCMHQDRELYEEFINPYTRQVSAPVRAGITLFRVGRCYGHGAIYDGTRYIHAWGRNGFAQVLRSPVSFFQKRDRKHFEVDEAWLLQSQ